MVDIVEFLLARYAERAAAARKCAEAFPSPWDVSDRGHVATVRADAPAFRSVTELEQWPGCGWLADYLDHIAQHDPASVLADCSAKRLLVIFLDPRAAPEGEGKFVAESVLRLLALSFADHPDYDSAWAAEIGLMSDG